VIFGESRFPLHARSNGGVMSRKWTLLALILSLGSSGALQANPLDSPGIVYIDGLPCNRACQAYMAWSRPGPAQRREVGEPTILVVPAEVGVERRDHTARPRVARQPMPVPRPAPRAGMANSNIKPSNAKPPNTKASHSKNAAAPTPAYQATAKAAPLAAAAVAPEKTAAAGQELERKSGSSGQIEPAQAASVAAAPLPESAKPEVIKPEVTKSEAIKSQVAAPPPATLEIAAPSAEQPRPETANAEAAKPEIAKPEFAKSEVAALPAATDAAPASASRTIQRQIAEATGMAERVTAMTLERELAGHSDNQDAKAATGDTDTASVSPANLDNLVAVVLARPEINSLSDLNNRSIAIGEKQSAASGSVSAALMAAGAAEVQFSEGKPEGNTAAIDRLISGEVPAAVLALASPEAAEWFPDIAGFRIFRLPLSQRARL
jgi:hypothetical protein